MQICVPNKILTVKHKDITELIIKASYTVYNTLGYGFQEKVYEKAMDIELRKLGSTVVRQAPADIYFRGHLVGEYKADLLVADAIIVEFEAARDFAPADEAQLLNYLKATIYELGLSLDFGP